MRKVGEKSKKGQLTIFIIVAIAIVFAIILFFSFKDSFFQTGLPKNMKPVYDSYTDCLESITTEGIYILGQQGGYIEVPNFEPGSSYRPFSSQLDFMGQPVAYWMYVSGNNLVKEQVPTKKHMKMELEDYVRERLYQCRFDDFKSSGYDVYLEDGDVSIDIQESSVILIAKNPITIYYENDTVRVDEHKVKVNIRLGKLYDQAKQIYDYEMSETFLEKYAQDVLRLHAPVDGVELSCTPKVFVDEEIRSNITKGLTANMNYIKIKGKYYEVKNKEYEYFVVNPGMKLDTNANLIYDPAWPTRVEIYGDRVAQPIGLQEGLSILGFCYVPYHLVYDINFPVLIQLWEGDFFFQFPVSVIIDKNYARNALPPMFESETLDNEVCKFKNQNVKVYTYDSGLNPLPSRIQFKCLDAQCEIGKSTTKAGVAVFEGTMPQCLNGFIVASAEGYADAKYQISTNEEVSADIFLSKIYNLELDLGNLPGDAVITFRGEKYSTTVLYPQMKTVELVEDYYNVSVSVYTNSTLTVKGLSEQKCVDVPVDGVGSLFGLTEERCQDINIPDMKVDTALIGGGKTQDYMTEDALKRSTKLNMQIPIYNKPQTIDDLQEIYSIVEDSLVYISFE